MIARLLAGLGTIGIMAGAAFAPTYIPISPPPAASAPPSVGVPGATPMITTVSPTTDHATTTTQGVDANGNEITKEESYREGIAGSSETHKTTVTDPDGGTTTTRSQPPHRNSRAFPPIISLLSPQHCPPRLPPRPRNARPISATAEASPPGERGGGAL